MDTQSPNTTCDNCGKEFFKPNAWKKNDANHYCSRPCYHVAHSKAMKGKRQPQLDANPASHEARKRGAKRGPANGAWKGGVTYRKRKGRYPSSVRYVRCPADFASMARKDGYVMEHRLIMAQHLGRPLLRSEVVHHINHVVTDNQLDNLQLFASNGEHKRHEGATGYFKAYYQAHPHTRTSRRKSP